MCLSFFQLRKPVVEKLRRDRINTCIEQLKALLGPEFLRQQPDSKQEKADILEMTVAYLRAWQQQAPGPVAPSPRSSGEGYSRCVQEAVSFLSHCQLQTPAHRRLLGHFQGLQESSRSPPASPPGSPLHQGKGVQLVSGGLWRPW